VGCGVNVISLCVLCAQGTGASLLCLLCVTERDDYVTINWENIEAGNVSVLSHITNTIKMHQFPVHTEHTKILHSLHTPLYTIYGIQGRVSKVLVLQKRFWTQSATALPIHFNYINKLQILYLSVIPPSNQSAPHTHLHHTDSPICLVTITISPILQHITLHNTLPDKACI
jgi:hypothetical protein